jgi:hypothetical protein
VVTVAFGATAVAAADGTPDASPSTPHLSGMSSAVASGIVVNGVAKTLHRETTSTRVRVTSSGSTVRLGSGAAYRIGGPTTARHTRSHHAIAPTR